MHLNKIAYCIKRFLFVENLDVALPHCLHSKFYYFYLTCKWEALCIKNILSVYSLDWLSA